jgi:peptidoglycan/LPS O-acetylase OafA/YrhL
LSLIGAGAPGRYDGRMEPEPKRLTSLDALRGIAALSVVFWHWQHFFAIKGDWQDGWSHGQEPLFWLLKPLYLQGWAAVDLFFVLSGFVFFWLYSDTIRTRAIGAGRFALLRLSRLYPLHFVLLLAAAALQFAFWRQTGQFFIYGANDVPHFIAQLFLVQRWWIDAPQSFDGPSWSISMEALLYVLFFALCRFGMRPGWRALLVALAAVPLIWVDEDIARGFIGFFMGGVMVACWKGLRVRADAAIVTRVLGWSAIAGWVVLAWLLYRDSPLVGGDETNAGFLIVFDIVLCPLTVLALAMRAKKEHPWLGFLGDISYATYMIHFPMQLALALIANRMGWTPQVFMQGWVMVLFYAVLIGLSTLSFRYFEKPMQRWLRRLSPARAALSEA